MIHAKMDIFGPVRKIRPAGFLGGVAGILGSSGIMTIIMGIVVQGLLLFSIILLTPLALVLSGCFLKTNVARSGAKSSGQRLDGREW